jgi:peptide-methionine (S)-S-oxide reductase
LTGIMAEPTIESLVLGGGCFWCTEAAYRLLPGVTHVTCGYAGGRKPRPTYEEICTGATGHAEVIKIDFDPQKVSLAAILEYFWKVHNPTQVGGQGGDHGTQYRSVIYPADEKQTAAAVQAKAAAQARFRDPITTEITPLAIFWPAEDYHQEYFKKHPEAGYCAHVIAPKVAHLKEALKK